MIDGPAVAGAAFPAAMHEAGALVSHAAHESGDKRDGRVAIIGGDQKISRLAPHIYSDIDELYVQDCGRSWLQQS